MTADETASGQPGALERAVTGDGLERVLGAGWSEPAARGQCWRNAPLVTADEQSESTARQLAHLHGSPGTENDVAPREHLRLQRLEAGAEASRRALRPDPTRLALRISRRRSPQEARKRCGPKRTTELGNDQSIRGGRDCIQTCQMLEPAARPWVRQRRSRTRGEPVGGGARSSVRAPCLGF